MRQATLPPRLRPDAELAVLDITEWFGETSGGIRTYLLEKAKYVAARPTLRHTLVVPGHRDRVTDADGVRLCRLRGPRIPGQKPYRFMFATRSIAHLLRHEHADIIEIGSPFLVPWMVRHATRSSAVPMVCFYHTNLPRQFAPAADTGGLVQRALRDATWRYMRRLDALVPLTIVASAYSARELARVGIDRVAQVPLGVDLAAFTPARRADADATRARLGLPAGPLAAFVGRFAREKELETVLDGWAEVERRCGARLALVGAGPMEATLRAHPYGHRVHFVPFVQDRATLADLLAALDVYVAAGPIETFGLSAIEALASGTPVLTVSEGAVVERVEASGAGRVFQRGEPTSLADEAVTLFGDDLAALGARGRAYAVAEHGWETVFDRLFTVYRSVLRREVPPVLRSARPAGVR
jgi:alpha-1,6-mannosyltransferase